MIYLIQYKNLCKCYDTPLPSTIIKKKKEEVETSEMYPYSEKCEIIGRRQPCASQNQSPQEKSNLLTLALRLSASRTVQK
jgi:hypothetical protein